MDQKEFEKCMSRLTPEGIEEEFFEDPDFDVNKKQKIIFLETMITVFGKTLEKVRQKMGGKIEELSAEEIRLLEIWLNDNLMGLELTGNMHYQKNGRWSEEWTPATNLNQIMECADKCDFYPSISKTPMGWTIFGGRPDRIRVVDDVSEIPLALCVTIKEGMQK